MKVFSQKVYNQIYETIVEKGFMLEEFTINEYMGKSLFFNPGIKDIPENAKCLFIQSVIDKKHYFILYENYNVYTLTCAPGELKQSETLLNTKDFKLAYLDTNLKYWLDVLEDINNTSTRRVDEVIVNDFNKKFKDLKQEDDNKSFTEEENIELKEQITKMIQNYEVVMESLIKNAGDNTQRVANLEKELRYVKDELFNVRNQVDTMSKNKWIKRFYFTSLKLAKNYPNTKKFIFSSDGIGKIRFLGPVALGVKALYEDLKLIEDKKV